MSERYLHYYVKFGDANDFMRSKLSNKGVNFNVAHAILLQQFDRWCSIMDRGSEMMQNGPSPTS